MFSLVPYLGGGIGFGSNVSEYKIKYDMGSSISQKRRDTDFAYQGIAGFTSMVSDNIKMRVQYIYHRGQQHTINHSALVAVVRDF